MGLGGCLDNFLFWQLICLGMLSLSKPDWSLWLHFPHSWDEDCVGLLISELRGESLRVTICHLCLFFCEISACFHSLSLRLRHQLHVNLTYLFLVLRPRTDDVAPDEAFSHQHWAWLLSLVRLPQLVVVDLDDLNEFAEQLLLILCGDSLLDLFLYYLQVQDKVIRNAELVQHPLNRRIVAWSLLAL